ncbi:hypothetical protein PSYAE_03182 [Pseudomonas amygdali pv. aesculi str. 0893_23]|uniref:hypothetical protein n=1 Tax=Pseudomonas syringae group genomosp. 2 TaxID=251698 RepID=UPI0001CC410A|nr:MULTISPECIES: hypothetical protein [Pseudomonas syringae group genomosp. 2]EGH00969.1 hypothetical protein PSYAE_03182 [Pseudomonas amygdali pv. aesculi str. 0893_23]KPW08180.1 Uncharacterized protein ALO90_02911 [Pseudomonas amygdali pv. aesculi]MCQ3009864.1 hypothetical protein [Pseudomonas savastanoi]
MPKKQNALDARAKRIAEKHGYRAERSESHYSSDNYGEFMLIEQSTNRIEAGHSYDMGAEQIIEFFEGDKV